MIKVALIDDHTLVRSALAEMINRFENCIVTLQATNGQEFIELLANESSPDLALIDINMPLMDGYETAKYLNEHHPTIKMMALSVEDEEEAIIKMLRSGAVGYLLKETDITDFKLALHEVMTKGYYHSEMVTNTLMNSLHQKKGPKKRVDEVIFQAREREFLELACTELTYKQIADIMCVSPRTIDGYRESLFIKLSIKSRVGLVLFAIRNGFFVI